MPFEDVLNTEVSIGKLVQKKNSQTGYVETTWETKHEAKARIRTLRGLQRISGDVNKVFATHRIYMGLEDLEQTLMHLDETLEAVEAVPFDYETQKHLPRYKFKLVDKPNNHHFEIDCERIVPGGT